MPGSAFASSYLPTEFSLLLLLRQCTNTFSFDRADALHDTDRKLRYYLFGRFFFWNCAHGSCNGYYAWRNFQKIHKFSTFTGIPKRLYFFRIRESVPAFSCQGIRTLRPGSLYLFLAEPGNLTEISDRNIPTEYRIISVFFQLSCYLERVFRNFRNLLVHYTCQFGAFYGYRTYLVSPRRSSASAFLS